MKRDIENIGTFVEKTVIPLPIRAITFEKISTGRRPMESAIVPNIVVPTTEPTKNIDWPMVDFHCDSHTQLSCLDWNNFQDESIPPQNDCFNMHRCDLLHCSCFDIHDRIHRSIYRTILHRCCLPRKNWNLDHLLCMACNADLCNWRRYFESRLLFCSAEHRDNTWKEKIESVENARLMRAKTHLNSISGQNLLFNFLLLIKGLKCVHEIIRSF